LSLNSDVWTCLICGFIGCGKKNLNHIGAHYEETLHTYAMNNDTRQVWDFTYDGYIHQFIFSNNDDNINNNSNSINRNNDDKDRMNGNNNASNGNDEVQSQYKPSSTSSSSSSTSSSSSSSTSIPQHHHHHQHHHHQNQHDQQQHKEEEESEDLIIHRKLETAAYNYNQILAWQMEQNRLIYMTRLQRIRDSVGYNNNSNNCINIDSGGDNNDVDDEIKGYDNTHIVKKNSNNNKINAKTIKQNINNNNDNNNHNNNNTNYNNKKNISNNKNKNVSKMKFVNERNWRDNIIQSIESEKNKLIKQHENLKSRLHHCYDDYEMLKEMNINLKNNKIEWENRIMIGNNEYKDVEKMYRYDDNYDDNNYICRRL
jgi:hypothetical protein